MAPHPSPPVPQQGAALNRPDLSPLARGFYARPALRLARDLLGRFLVRELEGALLVGRIVEVEAYRPDDPASHSYRGLTERNRSMFAAPGHAYVYRSYGIHACMNVAAGRGNAVLLRAVEPLVGVDGMARLRGLDEPRLLCAGPGRLCQAFGIALELDGHDLTRGRALWLAAGSPIRRATRTSRVGISTALEKPWRYVDPTSRFVSRGAARVRTGRGRAPARRRG